MECIGIHLKPYGTLLFRSALPPYFGSLDHGLLHYLPLLCSRVVTSVNHIPPLCFINFPIATTCKWFYI